MTPFLGRLLVLAALLFAATGAPLGFVAGARRNGRVLDAAKTLALCFGAAMLAANMLMVYALVTDDFSVGYVAEVGSQSTPLFFKVPSLWASLHGSILFWGGVLGAYTIGFTLLSRDEHQEYTPWALGTLLTVAVFFSLLVASIASPFETMSPVPTDGPGPNPLLQNHWLMAFHPPMLYGGYVGMAVPFSMAAAALMAGRLEAGWMAPLRRWLIIPWTFLTIGICMGGWWSYAVLGWGGYWAWDPVENASFLPWLAATAAIHSALVTERRGTLKTWTVLLVFTTFLLTLFGTFLTRSGVFNSVHSFTQSEIGPTFLVFIAMVAVFCLVLASSRDHVVEASDAGEEAVGALRKRLGPMHPLSRELMVFLQNLVFAVFTFTVLLGTVFPLLVEALQDRRLSVGEPYFDGMALPLGVLLVFLMGVGPALPWGQMAPDAAMRRFLPPVFGGIALAVLMFAIGFHGPYTAVAMFVCGFALVANVGEFVNPVLTRMRAHGEGPVPAAGKVLRRGRRRYGGHIAHFAVIMAVIAMALSKGYKHEVDVTLDRGETVQLGAYAFTYDGARLEKQPQREALIATFLVSKNGRSLGAMEPALNYYPRQREPVGTPWVHTGPGTDLYLSLIQVEQDGGYASLRVMTMPGVWWLWVSAPLFALASLVVLWPRRRGARAEARKEAA